MEEPTKRSKRKNDPNEIMPLPEVGEDELRAPGTFPIKCIAGAHVSRCANNPDQIGTMAKYGFVPVQSLKKLQEKYPELTRHPWIVNEELCQPDLSGQFLLYKGDAVIICKQSRYDALSAEQKRKADLALYGPPKEEEPAPARGQVGPAAPPRVAVSDAMIDAAIAEKEAAEGAPV
jgi:hypothetical protein